MPIKSNTPNPVNMKIINKSGFFIFIYLSKFKMRHYPRVDKLDNQLLFGGGDSLLPWLSMNLIMRRGSTKMRTVKPFFPLGQIVATPGAIDALMRANQDVQDFLNRHREGDWGDLQNEDKGENEFSLEHGFRILSSYTTAAGEKLWVITEADRSATMLLLAEEY